MGPGRIMPETVDDAINGIQATVKAGDYFGDDGLLYCGKCHTPKQVRLNFFGEERILPALCECAEADLRRRKEEREKREFERRVQRLRDVCFVSDKMHDYTFAGDDGLDIRALTACKRYVAQWSDMKAENIGLLFYGDVGTGKTYYAACIANALIDQGVRVLMTSFPRIVNTMQGMFEGRQEYLDEIVNYPLLIIDDLGAERDSSFMMEQVFNIIDARYQIGKPLIVTTNLSIEAIKKPSDPQYKRLYDRILERCFPVKMSGISRRRKQLHDDYARRARMLGLE